MNTTLSLYIHIPFCINKCPYCDFYSVNYNKHLLNEYVENLCLKISNYSKTYNKKIDTIYFGGGTPSVLGTENILKILNCIYKSFSVINPEITVEVNPCTHEKLNFKSLKYNGVNRISLGMQSINDEELKMLGRIHQHKDLINCIEKIKISDIKNFSLDVMVGISKQTPQSLKDTLRFCKEVDATHVSAYILKIEENTKYNSIRELLNLPDEDTVSDYYILMCDYLNNNEYKQYEISNFSKKGYESKHNLKYWNCDEYLGIGPSAHSFVSGKRFYTPNDIESFNKDIIIQDGIGGDIREYIMMRLRLNEGIIFNEFYNRFNKAIPDKYIKNASDIKLKNFVNVDDKRINLTSNGFLLSNYIISIILDGYYS